MPSTFGDAPATDKPSASSFGDAPVAQASRFGQFGRPTEPTAQMSEFLKATGGPQGKVLAGPVLPNETQLLSMALGTAGGAVSGMSAHAIAKRLGAPDDVANVIGGIAGIGGGLLAGSRSNLLTKAFQSRSDPAVWSALKNVVLNKKGLGGWADLETALNPPPQAPTPFKPSAGTARSMGTYGGTYEPNLQVGKQIPRGKFVPPAEPGPTPYPTGKGTGTDYGGPTNPYLNPPGTVIPRGKFTPPTEPPSTPYPPGKGTGTKYGGSENLYGGPSYRSAPAKGQLRAPQTSGESGPAGEAVDFGDIPEQYQGGAASKAKEIAGNRFSKVSKLADLARKNGITKADVANMTDVELKMLAKAGKYAEISPITKKHLMDALE